MKLPILSPLSEQSYVITVQVNTRTPLTLNTVIIFLITFRT